MGLEWHDAALHARCEGDAWTTAQGVVTQLHAGDGRRAGWL